MVMGSPLAALANSVGRLSFLRSVIPQLLRTGGAPRGPAQPPVRGASRLRLTQSRRRAWSAASYVDQDLRRQLTRSRGGVVRGGGPSQERRGGRALRRAHPLPAARGPRAAPSSAGRRRPGGRQRRRSAVAAPPGGAPPPRADPAPPVGSLGARPGAVSGRRGVPERTGP